MGGMPCEVCGLDAKEIHFHLLSIRKQHLVSLFNNYYYLCVSMSTLL